MEPQMARRSGLNCSMKVMLDGSYVTNVDRYMALDNMTLHIAQ